MSYYLALPIFQAVLSLVLLIVILRAKSQDSARHLFALYLTGLLVWGVLIFLMRSSPNLDAALIWEKLLLPLGLLLTVIIYHFSVVFGGCKIKKWVLPLGYGCSVLALILSEVGWVVADMQLKSYGYAPVAGPLFGVVAFGSYVFVVSAIINLWKYSRTSQFNDERTKSIYIFVGLVISMAGGAMDVLPLLGLPLYPGVIIGNIIFCLLTSIAILRYHLLGTRIIVRKGTTYFLASAVAVTPYLVALIVFERVLRSTIPIWAWIIMFIILAFVLQPIWRVIQSAVDRLFYMNRYDFLRALDDFSQKTHRLSDVKALGNSLVKLIGRALQCSNVYLFVPSAKGEFNLISSTRDDFPIPEYFGFNPVLVWLRDQKSVLRREEMAYISRLQSLTAKEIAEINAINAELFVPVLDKDDKAVGILVLGPKLNRQPYSDEDEQMILTVTHRLALELENARLYSQEVIARQELQKQNEIKTEFLHSAAHELKTPLTAIISSSEILTEKLSLNGEELDQKLISNIYASSLAMNKRVSELLDFARIQIGTLELNKQQLDVNSVAHDVASRLSSLFTSRRQRLDLDMQTVTGINADKDKLEQVFINLLSNANKFSPNDSEIVVRTKQNNGTVLIEVEDSAPIISEEEKRKIFTPYYRGEDIKVRQRVPGLGLGLAITKKIIEMHGGRIWIASKPGKGNIFTFSLAAS